MRCVRHMLETVLFALRVVFTSISYLIHTSRWAQKPCTRDHAKAKTSQRARGNAPLRSTPCTVLLVTYGKYLSCATFRTGFVRFGHGFGSLGNGFGVRQFRCVDV